MGPSTAGPRSRRLFRAALGQLPGGVDSPVRSFAAVGGTPLFMARGAGPYLEDVDGRRFLDLVASWGALILGHAHPKVVQAIAETARKGTGFGAPSELEHGLAGRIRRAVPEAERLRFVNSGTEAVMSAVRVARAATGRSKIVTFAGAYHGHSDGLLARAGSGIATASLPGSAGVPDAIVAETLVARYNDPEGLARLFESRGDEIAAVLIEPIAGNMGVVPATPRFLGTVARVCRRAGALLLADEVITGFRLRRGAISTRLGLRPDLLTFGKVIGGGLPIGAYGGRRALMDSVAPLGPVYQAGTLAGNPVVMAAGAATLDALTPPLYRALERQAGELEGMLRTLHAGRGPFTLQRAGSMFGLFFTSHPVTDLESAEATDRRRYAAFFHSALRGRVYLPPAPLETAFLSTAVGPDDLRGAEAGFEAGFRAAARVGR